MSTSTTTDKPGGKAFSPRLIPLLPLVAFLFLLAGAAAPPSLAEEAAQPPAGGAQEDAATGTAGGDEPAAETAADEGATDEEASPELQAAARSKLGARPTARADAYNVAQDKTRVVKAPGVLANDSRRRPVVVKFVLGVEYGKLSLGKSGGFSYTPDPNFRGVDYFKYRICEKRYPSRCSSAVAVKLTVQGAAPVARNDTILAKKNHTKTLDAPGLRRNDYDPNGDPTRVISYSQPRRGGVVVGTAGNLRFRPDRNFVGKTTFRYWIGDGTGLRDSALATFRVRR